MSKYKYRFTLHQAYAHYANHGDLNWRDVAESARVSTRTLRKYFESSENLSEMLADYHIKYLNRYYERSVVNPKKYDEFPARLIFFVMLRNKIIYLFTDKAAKNDLVGRGLGIKKLHLQLIEEAMIQGGTNPKNLDPELVFNNLILPLEKSKNSEEFFNHMMKWFLQES